MTQISDGTLTTYPRAIHRSRCCSCQPYHGNLEALGWALDAVARIVAFTSSAVYLSVAIVSLAKRQAGCEVETDTNDICDVRVYGLRPSSLLTTYSTIVGIISAFSLPVVGAVVDYTCHRKFIGLITAIAQILLVSSQIFLNESNWFIITISQVFNAFIGWVHTLAVFAYLPELTENSKQLVNWTTSFHVLQYVSLILFLASMLGILKFSGFDGANDQIPASRISNALAVSVITPFYMLTWTFLMRKKNAFHELPGNSSLWTIGFVKVFQTSKTLYQNHRSLMWFFFNVALVEASQQSLASISLTYMTDTLDFTALESGIAFFLLFFFSIVGALIGKISLYFINPIRSNQLCLIFTVANTVIAALILSGPGQQFRAYVVASAWGIGAGWKSVVERFTTCQIIPKGQDAELMGFYLFSTQILVWLPTLIFTAMNESGVDQRIGLSMLIIFNLGGFICLCLMGSYDKCVRLANSIQTKQQIVDDNDEDNKI